MSDRLPLFSKRGDVSVPKILLLVNSDPSGSGVGELFLADLARSYPKGQLVRYSMVQSRQQNRNVYWLGFKGLNRYVPSSSIPIKSSIHEWVFRATGARRTLEDIEAVLRADGIDTIWAVLSSGPVIYLADALAARGWRVVSTVLDDPRYFGANQRLDPVTRAQLFESFASVLRRSAAVSVVGEGMQNAYKERFGTDALILRHGIDDDLFHSWRSPRTDEIVRIVFAGSLYAKHEWNAMVDALEAVDWRIDGRHISLSFIGTPPKRGIRRSSTVNYMGRMDFNQTLATVRTCSVAYLPYWFGSRHAVAARTSFPGKLSAYAACGIPVLFHGPEDSSVTPFLQRFPFGMCCHSLAASDIIKTISLIISDQEFQQNAAEAQRAAFFSELSLTAMKERFLTLLGAGAGLRPIAI